MLTLSRGQVLVYVLSLAALVYFVNTPPNMLLDEKTKKLNGFSVALAFLVTNILLSVVVSFVLDMSKGSGSMYDNMTPTSELTSSLSEFSPRMPSS